jgi:hypothetical protein
MKKAGGRCHTIKSLDVQRELMARHGADVVFEEKLSGKDADNRPELQKAFKHGVSAMQISNAKRVVGYCRNEVHSPTDVNPANQLFAGQRGEPKRRELQRRF